MKVTKQYLKKLIKEELTQEANFSAPLEEVKPMPNREKKQEEYIKQIKRSLRERYHKLDSGMAALNIDVTQFIEGEKMINSIRPIIDSLAKTNPIVRNALKENGNSIMATLDDLSLFFDEY